MRVKFFQLCRLRYSSTRKCWHNPDLSDRVLACYVVFLVLYGMVGHRAASCFLRVAFTPANTFPSRWTFGLLPVFSLASAATQGILHRPCAGISHHGHLCGIQSLRRIISRKGMLSEPKGKYPNCSPKRLHAFPFPRQCGSVLVTFAGCQSLGNPESAGSPSSRLAGAKHVSRRLKKETNVKVYESPV